MKVKRGLAILLSSVMVVQMSVMAFADEYPTTSEVPCENIISEEFKETESTIIRTDTTVEEHECSASLTDSGEAGDERYTYTATPAGNKAFFHWAISDNDHEYTVTYEKAQGGQQIGSEYLENYGPSFSTSSLIENIVAIFKVFEQSNPEPVTDNNNNDYQEPQQNEEPKEPEEPDTTGQINIVDTSAGNALPTAELGDAIASTRTLSLNICNISPRQYSKAVQDTVAKTPEGGNIVIETNQVSCFDKNMMAAFAKKSSVNIFVVFKNKAGKKVLVTIPAGYDVMSLLDDNGYCGFMHLADVFGSREL